MANEVDRRKAVGMAFKSAFDALTRGDRAMLRRADDPFALAGFWQCIREAEDATGNQVPTSERLILQKMLPLADLYNASDLDVGQMLKTAKINLRRAEVILASRDLDDVIQNLVAISGIHKAAEEGMNFGFLLQDLHSFNYDSSRARMRWADNYFTPPTKQKGAAA